MAAWKLAIAQPWEVEFHLWRRALSPLLPCSAGWAELAFRGSCSCKFESFQLQPFQQPEQQKCDSRGEGREDAAVDCTGQFVPPRQHLAVQCQGHKDHRNPALGTRGWAGLWRFGEPAWCSGGCFCHCIIQKLIVKKKCFSVVAKRKYEPDVNPRSADSQKQ